MNYKYDLNYINDYVNSNSLEFRNNFNDDVAIVIIGHLSHIDTLILFYKGIKNVIFVVDETEEPSKIERLKDNGFIVEINEVKKIISGYGNVNYQCTSSTIGILKSKEMGYKFVLRMRSDQIILQLKDFINKMNFTKLGFFAYIPQEVPYHGNPNYGEATEYILEKNSLEGVNTEKLKYSYLMDYCITGEINDLLILFDYYEDKRILAPAEHKLLVNFLTKKNLDLDNSFEVMKNKFNFFLETLIENSIDFIMIKQDYNNWSFCLKHDSPNLYLY